MERVDIKIRSMYRDLLKEYCKSNGLKMYRVVERLIETNCKLYEPPKRKLLTSEYDT
jgi:hypothetical protein